MTILKTKAAINGVNNADNLYVQDHRRSGKRLCYELIKTSALTLFGTSILVGMHHQYRKRRHPKARIQDYIAGVQTRIDAIVSSPSFVGDLRPTKQLTRLQQSYHAAKQTYLNHDETIFSHSKVDHKLAALHTTTMIARPVCWVSGVASMPKTMPASENNDENDFGVVGIDAQRQLVWQTTMPERVHDIVVQPMAKDQKQLDKQSGDVVVMGRRPSETFWVLDAATGKVKHAIEASADRHFYGHACYSLDGQRLYVTENDTVTLTGKIGSYAIDDNYRKIREFDSYGIGPHELIMHPDNQTLIIANGGIKTEQASREELNLDSMQPSLVYISCHDGQLLEQVIPEQNQMSVRHLAIHDDGTVAIGIQYQGERHINVPLVLIHRRGDTEFTPLIMPNDQWQVFHQYIASIAVDSAQNQVCIATPMGGCAAIFDLETHHLIDTVRLPDCAGVALNTEKPGFIVSDGNGHLTTLSSSTKENQDSNKDPIMTHSQQHAMSFDNHLQALAWSVADE